MIGTLSALAICSAAILSTDLGICVVHQPPTLEAGFLVEGPDMVNCIAARASDCSYVSGCNYLGGVIAGCFDLPGGVNHLFDVSEPVAPGDCVFVSFITAR